MPRNQAGFDVTVHAVNLAPTSVEYQAVATTFYQTVGNYSISGIERIQNPHLYQSYQLRKQKMDKDNGGNNERQLFHGTSPDNVSKINSQGFNRSFSGTASGMYTTTLIGHNLVSQQFYKVPLQTNAIWKTLLTKTYRRVILAFSPFATFHTKVLTESKPA